MSRRAERFMARVREFERDGLPAIAAHVSAEFAVRALEGIVLRTPVDTGHARGNWQVVYFGPQAAELPVFDPLGHATVLRGMERLRNVRPFQNVFISNTVPYIVPLEHGHSKQAPTGMVALTVAELTARAKQHGETAARRAKAKRRAR